MSHGSKLQVKVLGIYIFPDSFGYKALKPNSNQFELKEGIF